jgi:hypothetical protein
MRVRCGAFDRGNTEDPGETAISPRSHVDRPLLLDSRARAENVVTEHVTLIDGTRAPQADMTVAVDDERIATVTPTAGTISTSS